MCIFLHLLDHTIAGFPLEAEGCDHHFRSKFRDLGGGSEQRGLRDPSANHSYATPTYHLLRQSFIRHSDAVRLYARCRSLVQGVNIFRVERGEWDERTIIYTQYIFNSLLVFYVLTVCVLFLSSLFLISNTSTTPTPYIVFIYLFILHNLNGTLPYYIFVSAHLTNFSESSSYFTLTSQASVL